MEAAVIDKIVELRDEGIVKEIEGIPFAARKLEPIIFEPGVDTIETNSLTGLIDYVKSAIEGPDALSGAFFHVVDHKTVRITTRISGKLRKRDNWAEATLDKNLEAFHFGDFMSPEAFNIKLRSIFFPTADLEKLVAYCSKLTAGTEVKLLDDGITQEASIKKTISGATKENVIAPVTVTLRPYRTFREIEQPSSEFLFRITLQNDIPKCGLFEADGGEWRLTAIKTITEFLNNGDTGLIVVA
jgi:hypothetical protein